MPLSRNRAFGDKPGRKKVALGFADQPTVAILDGFTLERLEGPRVDDLDGGDLMRVAWSVDGQTLIASGAYKDCTGSRPILSREAFS